MEPDDVPWLPIVVDEGQPAQTAGMLVHIKGRPVIVTDEGSVIASNGRNVAATLAVPIKVEDPSASLSNLDGQQVIVAGTLRGQHLSVESPNELTLRPAPEKNVPGLPRAMSPRNRSRSVYTIARRPAAEQRLIERGTLLDAWTDDRTGRRVALTTDAMAVEEALRPYYRNTLSVVESRWKLQYLDEIRASIDEELLLSSGNTITPSNQLQAAMTLLHLPSRLVHHLTRFRADALNLNVLVKPLTTI